MTRIRIRQVLIVIGFVALSIAVGVVLPGCGGDGGEFRTASASSGRGKTT